MQKHSDLETDKYLANRFQMILVIVEHNQAKMQLQLRLNVVDIWFPVIMHIFPSIGCTLQMHANGCDHQPVPRQFIHICYGLGWRTGQILWYHHLGLRGTYRTQHEWIRDIRDVARSVFGSSAYFCSSIWGLFHWKCFIVIPNLDKFTSFPYKLFTTFSNMD